MDRMELLERLSQLPTGNIADAMYNLSVPIRTVDDIPPLQKGQRRTAGYALTLKQAMRKDPFGKPGLVQHLHVIDEVLKEGDLLVFDIGGQKNVCATGALFSRRAKMKGAKGFLVNGCMRDLEELYDLDFPIHLLGGNPLKSAALLETVGINIPVQINGTQIKPGDVIVMDATGILAISPEDAEKVLLEAEYISRGESGILEKVKDGNSVLKAFSEAFDKN